MKNKMYTSALMILAVFFMLSPALLFGQDETKKTKPIIELFEENPTSIPLNPEDASLHPSDLFRDPNDNPKREPGPINIQKAIGGVYYQGIPTFFRLPVALSKEDLVAGEVDVAIMGASQDLSGGMRGTAFGPQAVRTGERVGAWGDLLTSAHPSAGEVDWAKVLTCVDYGDAPIDLNSNERSVAPVHKMVKEICEAGAVPIIVGGDHSLMYPDVVAVTDVYGKGNVAVIHFDAHFDGLPGYFGHYLTHGGPVKLLIDEGHVKGKNFIQIGLNSAKPGKKDIEWMRANQVRYHLWQRLTGTDGKPL